MKEMLIYIADDGTRFDSAKECSKHDETLAVFTRATKRFLMEEPAPSLGRVLGIDPDHPLDKIFRTSTIVYADDPAGKWGATVERVDMNGIVTLLWRNIHTGDLEAHGEAYTLRGLTRDLDSDDPVLCVV